MNKLLKFTSITLVLSIIGVIISLFIASNNDLSLFSSSLVGLLLSGGIFLTDTSSIDILYVLRVFALSLFMLASVILAIKLLKKKQFFIAIISFISFVFLGSILLTSSSVLYTNFPDTTVTESFLEPVLNLVAGGLMTTNQYLVFGSLGFFVVVFLLHHVFILFFLPNPLSVDGNDTYLASKSSIIAEELSRFVIPSLLVSTSSNQSVVTSLPVESKPTNVSTHVEETTRPMTMVAPSVVKPIALPATDPNVANARAQVLQLKEKIRKIIRLELDKQMPLFVKKDDPIIPLPVPKTYVEAKPLPEVSLTSQTSDIQNKVKDIIESQLSTLEPKTKEMVAYLINEELIKYDALNREVLETFIQEKIQLTTADAVDALRQELTAVYEDKIQALTAQAAAGQPTVRPMQENQEATIPSPLQETQVSQMVETILQKHPLLQVIQVPQQDHAKAIDLEQMKQEIIETLSHQFSKDNADVSTQPVSGPMVTEEDLSKLKEEILLSLRTDESVPLKTDSPQPLIDVESIKKDILQSIKNDASFVVASPVIAQKDPSILNHQDLVTLKNEILLEIKQESVDNDKTIPVSTSSNESLDKLGIIEVVDDYLSHHNLFKDGFSTIIPPTIKIKEAKAPKNQQRTNQFKTVVPIEEGLTRTGKKKIIRIPFYQRMAVAHPSITSQYDDLKNYILAFKVKSRLSNTGDTFRLHKEEFIKITLAGKALKLYFALNPKSYDDTTIPVDDVSDKKMYRDMPLMFKVKSGLSIKRAKILIDDLMKSKDLAQKAVGSIQWSLQFKKL